MGELMDKDINCEFMLVKAKKLLNDSFYFHVQYDKYFNIANKLNFIKRIFAEPVKNAEYKKKMSSNESSAQD